LKRKKIKEESMRKTLAGCALALIGAWGATIQTQAAEYVSPDTVTLSAKDKKAVTQAMEWSRGGSQPFMSNGKLTYVHGAGSATIVAEPFQVADVELEPGERVNEIVVGDSARWLVESGEAGRSVHIFIKPFR
jgi:type IV secretion system protein VirB9